MKKMIERFFNWQSDMNWTWGPWLQFRPKEDTHFRPLLLFQLYFSAVFVALLIIGLLWAGPYLSAWFAPPSRSGITFTGFAFWLGMQLKPILLPVSLGLAAAFTPFVWAWNRRATRLQRETSAVAAEPPAGVWPPPPKPPYL